MRERILLIEFEDLVVNLDQDATRLEEFIGDSFGAEIRRIFKRENCPRTIEHTEREANQ